MTAADMILWCRLERGSDLPCICTLAWPYAPDLLLHCATVGYLLPWQPESPTSSFRHHVFLSCPWLLRLCQMHLIPCQAVDRAQSQQGVPIRAVNMICWLLQAPGAAAEGAAQKDSWRTLPVEKRLQHALVKGIDEFAVSSWLAMPHLSCQLACFQGQVRANPCLINGCAVRLQLAQGCHFLLSAPPALGKQPCNKAVSIAAVLNRALHSGSRSCFCGRACWQALSFP